MFRLSGFTTEAQAEAYGASPSATAAANTAAIQLALNGTGLVTLTKPGTYSIEKTLFIPSNTHFYVGPGVTIYLANSSNCNIIRNSQSAALIRNTDVVRSLTTVTVTDYGHNKVVGDYVLVASGKGTDATYIGEYQVVSVSGNTWTYTTSTSGAPTTPTNWLWVYHNYERLAYTAFSGNGTTVTVTEAGHKRRIGDPVWVNGVTPTSGVFDGLYEVTAITSTTWSYTATGQTPTAGTAKVMGQRNIKVTVDGLLDGNADNQSGFAVNGNGVYFQCVGQGSFEGNISNIDFRCVGTAAVTDFSIPRAQFLGTLVGVQLEGFWNRVDVQNITHQGTDDCVAFTQTNPAWAGGGTDYSYTASPFGIRSSDNAMAKNLRGAPSLSITKIVGYTGYSLGSIEFDGVYGETTDTPIRVMDDYYGVGGSANRIVLKNIDVAFPSSTEFVLFTLSGTVEYFSLSEFVLPAALYFALFQASSIASGPGTVNKFFVEKWRQTAAVTSSWCNIGGGAVAGFTITDAEFNSGNMFTASAQSGIRLVDTSTRVDRTSIKNVHVHSAGDRNTPAFHQGAGKIERVLFDGVTAYGMSAMYYNTTGSTAVTSATGITVQMSNLHLRHCAPPINCSVNLKYNEILTNIRLEGTTANYLNQSVAGTHRMKVSGISRVNESDNVEWGIGAGTDVDAFYIGNGTTSAAIFSIFGPEVTMNIAGYGGGAGYNTYTPLDGDIVYNNNPAPGGTINVVGPVVRSSTSGAPAWHLLANPALLW